MNLKLGQLVGLVIILLIIIISAVIWAVRGSQGEYSMVYVSTGEIYVGKLATFPNLKLTGAFAIVTNKETGNVEMKAFSGAVWAPREVIFNREQVVFYGPLTEDSQALARLKNPAAFKSAPEAVTQPVSPPAGENQ